MIHQEKGEELWIISGDAGCCDNVESALRSLERVIRRVEPASLDEPQFWRRCEKLPGVIVLDVDGRLDWGEAVLRAIKRSHVTSPVIVISTNFTREFGTKIVSEGICYALPRDFDGNEFREVVCSLFRPHHAARG